MSIVPNKQPTSPPELHSTTPYGAFHAYGAAPSSDETTPFRAFHAYGATADSADWPEPLGQEAFHGLAGDVVHTIAPHSEADPAALLIQFLASVGNVVGRTAHFSAEQTKHFCNLFAVMVGATAKGRKGSSWSQIERIMKDVDPEWTEHRVKSGLSSGEGLIWNVRDPITANEPVKERGKVVGYQEVMKDQGESDKRLLLIESEYVSILKVMTREGNTLSDVIRNAWDRGNLQSLTKNSPAKATNAHVSIVGHITLDEVRRYLTATEQTNGFGNRFLWVCVKRSKCLPDGGNLPYITLVPFIERLQHIIEFARNTDEITRDEEAKTLWHQVYPTLSEGKPGLFGGMISRAESQVMRLAVLYAVLDLSPVVMLPHLKAALAVWNYCEQSARHCFGSAVGDRNADIIKDALSNSPEGLSRNDIRESVFKRHIQAAELDRSLSVLQENGIASRKTITTRGRPEERWFLCGEVAP